MPLNPHSPESIEMDYHYWHKGWAAQAILLKRGGDAVVCLQRVTGREPRLSLHGTNHNVFRVSATGQTIWEVQRDAGEWSAWGKRRVVAESAATEFVDEDSLVNPFLRMEMHFPDFTSNVVLGEPTTPLMDEWRRNATVVCATQDFRYHLNLETGIAVNLTPLHQARLRWW